MCQEPGAQGRRGRGRGPPAQTPEPDAQTPAQPSRGLQWPQCPSWWRPLQVIWGHWAGAAGPSVRRGSAQALWSGEVTSWQATSDTDLGLPAPPIPAWVSWRPTRSSLCSRPGVRPLRVDSREDWLRRQAAVCVRRLLCARSLWLCRHRSLAAALGAGKLRPGRAVTCPVSQSGGMEGLGSEVHGGELCWQGSGRTAEARGVAGPEGLGRAQRSCEEVPAGWGDRALTS